MRYLFALLAAALMPSAWGDGLDLDNCTAANNQRLPDFVCERLRKGAEEGRKRQRTWPGMNDQFVRPFVPAGYDLDRCTDDQGLPMLPLVCSATRNSVVLGAEKARDDRAAAEEKRLADAAAARVAATEREQERARINALTAVAPAVQVQNEHIPSRSGSHLWSWHEGGRYGYRRDPSPQERFQGVHTAPLFVVSASLDGPIWNFVTNSPNSPLMQCRIPCEVMNVITLGVGAQIIPIDRGSVLWDVVQDAQHGQLGIFRTPAGNGRGATP